MAKQKITTKNGVSYERNGKDKVYDTVIYARFNSAKAKKLDEIANKKGIKTSSLIRNILEEFLDKEV